MIVLIIGDLHIPYRAAEMSKVFRDHLTPGKVHQILCTGNVCTKSELEYFRTICNDVIVVRGQYDDDDIAKESETVVNLGTFRAGLVSDADLFPIDDPARLSLKRRELNVDILIHGGSPKAYALEYDGGFLLAPGSATGAFTASNTNPVPSFILLNIQGTTIAVYLYSLAEDGTINVTKRKFQKDEE